MLRLYTQPRCGYCTILRAVLDQTDIEYEVIDIVDDETAKKFIIAEGHRTVPQLYYKHYKINNIDTDKITPEYIINAVAIYADIEETWPWQDSGIEDFT